MELEVTWKRAIRVWWAYFWRSLFAIVLCWITYFVFTTITKLFIDFESNFSSIVFYLIYFVSIYIIPFKMILNKNFGKFRLVLIENTVEKE